jgi:hypothetical protein
MEVPALERVMKPEFVCPIQLSDTDPLAESRLLMSFLTFHI